MIESSNLTAEEWTREYLDTYVYPVLKPSAAEHYADYLLKHFVPALGEERMADITAARLQVFLSEQADHGGLNGGKPLSAKTVKNLRTAISACFKRAVACGVIPANPVPDTVIRRTPKPAVDVMSEEDRTRLLEFCLRDGALMNVGIILAAELGLRRGEVCALRWSDYGGDYLTINNTVKRLQNKDGRAVSARADGARAEGARTELVFGPVKTEQSKRVLALTPFLKQVLESQKKRFETHFGPARGGDFIVFNSTGGMTDPDNLSHYFGDVQALLELPHVKLHALRHTFASRAVEAGIDIETVSGLLGHTDVATTAHYYLHPRQQAMNNALWRLSSVLGTAPSFVPRGYLGEESPRNLRRRKTL